MKPLMNVIPGLIQRATRTTRDDPNCPPDHAYLNAEAIPLKELTSSKKICVICEICVKINHLKLRDCGKFTAKLSACLREQLQRMAADSVEHGVEAVGAGGGEVVGEADFANEVGFGVDDLSGAAAGVDLA